MKYKINYLKMNYYLKVNYVICVSGGISNYLKDF